MSVTNREQTKVDIACVGFGPSTAGFLSEMAKNIMGPSGEILLESKAIEGLPLQILCYERADDASFGVSGVVTKAKYIKEAFDSAELKEIPMGVPVSHEELVYLLDPSGASRRSFLLKIVDLLLKPICKKNFAFKFPIIPPFLNKHGGFVFSIGQFQSWVSTKLMTTGLIQVWPSSPVKEPLFEGNKMVGIRLVDQGVDKTGKELASFIPGMDVLADCTVIGDGPYGPVGRKINEHLGVPADFEKEDYALGMKFVVELPDNSSLKAGTVLHTVGYPEPEIFGFLYVHPNNIASLGIFIPSWLNNPARTAYRYLQHFMMHPYIWQYVKGGTLRSWGAKTIDEAGKRGEPILVGDGFARIGEGSGTTNILTNSGVDEAFYSGTLLAKAFTQILKDKKTFTKESLTKTYIKLRKESLLDKEAQIAKKARDGFSRGIVLGFLGVGLSWLTRGFLSVPRKKVNLKALSEEVKRLRIKKPLDPVHDEAMTLQGWPKINFDGKLLVSHQDALLLGGKVQASQNTKDHVSFIDSKLCEKCEGKLCVEMCSGQAIMPSEKGTPDFDREKCVHCGACIWNCIKFYEDKTNINFEAGSGGLHSSEN